MRMTRLLSVGTTLLAVCATTLVLAQPPKNGDQGDRRERRERGDRGERGGREGGPPREGRGPGSRPNFIMMMPIIVVLDVNKDGEISKEEMENATAALQKLDKDKNGKLTEDELRPDFGRRGGPGGGPGGFGRRDGGDGDRGGNRGGGDFVERMLKNDKNKDGKLTKDELPERMQPMFDRIDTNKDKELDKAELTKMSEQFNSRNRSGGRNRGNRDSDKDRPKRPETEN